MTITGFEIDFLPVGEKSKSGDAILFRYKEDGKCKVMLIDGGHKESEGTKTSDKILKHMREYYYPEVDDDVEMRIDHIVCSHPDSDHVGGLQEVMEQCDVGTLWINNPLDYVNYSDLDDEHNTDSFCKGNADTVEQLIDIAEQNNIAVESPLEGKFIGPLVVCSPSEEFYEVLVKGELQRKGGDKSKLSIKKVVAATIRRFVEAIWSRDYLKDCPSTSVCNESSTVLFGDLVDGKNRILLTADAGIEALSRSYEYLEDAHNYSSGSMTFMQMPHHGSRRNVNTEVLDNILGRKLPGSTHEGRGSSIASVAKESDDRPRKSVTNAFITRGFSCMRTAGYQICHIRGDMPDRNWPSATQIGYAHKVEDPDE